MDSPLLDTYVPKKELEKLQTENDRLKEDVKILVLCLGAIINREEEDNEMIVYDKELHAMHDCSLHYYWNEKLRGWELSVQRDHRTAFFGPRLIDDGKEQYT